MMENKMHDLGKLTGADLYPDVILEILRAIEARVASIEEMLAKKAGEKKQ